MVARPRHPAHRRAARTRSRPQRPPAGSSAGCCLPRPAPRPARARPSGRRRLLHGTPAPPVSRRSLGQSDSGPRTRPRRRSAGGMAWTAAESRLKTRTAAGAFVERRASKGAIGAWVVAALRSSPRMRRELVLGDRGMPWGEGGGETPEAATPGPSPGTTPAPVTTSPDPPAPSWRSGADDSRAALSAPVDAAGASAAGPSLRPVHMRMRPALARQFFIAARMVVAALCVCGNEPSPLC